ncbi:hypothetical protein [Hydrogenophaga defluvii]|uniref:Uncharacterized protein n=1 Tax=Hydrogenophaga defluvii TaxID=249410 RepID=A0ABW2SB79_9BURK
MANVLYVKGKERIGRAQVNLETADIKAALVKNTYAQNLITDEFYTSISAHVLGTPVALTGKTFASGIFDADDLSFPTIAAGDTAEAVVLFVDTGNPATSFLLFYCDTITGFPLATSGGDVDVRWDNGAYKIFSF